MKKHVFQLPNDESLILISGFVNDEKAVLALDTGASQTVFDLNLLLMAGIEMKDAIEIVWIETASGVVEAHIFELERFFILGIERRNFKVCAYDFLSHNILTTIDGLLGLDFFRGKDLTISFKSFEIVVD